MRILPTALLAIAVCATAASAAPNRADFSITITDAPDPVAENSTLTYTVTVTNAGPREGITTTVTVTLATGVVFSSASGSGWTCGASGQVVTCTRPTVALGTIPAITVQVVPTLDGAIDATANVSSVTPDPDATNNTDVASTTVLDGNDPPTAVDDAVTVDEDDAATTIAVLANDTIAPDTGETLTLIAVGGAGDGTTAITGGGTGVSYEPDDDFHGSDSFTYTISDGNGGTDTATVTVTVTSVNDPPQATDDGLVIDEDDGITTIDVLANDSAAPDIGETLRVMSVGAATGGTTSVAGGGTTVRYEPDPDFSGSDSFTVTVTDGNGGTDTSTVLVTINPLNDDPTAVDDAGNAVRDGPAVAVNVLANDTIAPDAGETLTITDVTQGSNGTVVITGGGTGVTYQPASGFVGNDAFTYLVSDGNGGTDSATVTMAVTTVPIDDDVDDDGITNANEGTLGTDPDSEDSDGDEIMDGTEIGLTAPQGTGTFLPIDHFVADEDPTTTTDPLDVDTDGGTKPDGDEDEDQDGEVDAGETDPNDPSDDIPPPDDDLDNDGIPDDLDVCPENRDPDQDDADGDGQGDLCDPDADGDGFPDDYAASGGGCSTSGGGSIGLVVLLLLIFRRKASGLGVLGALAVISAPAHAQTAEEPAAFALERMRASIDRNGVIAAESAAIPEHGTWDVGVWLGRADDPMVVYHMEGAERVGSLVRRRDGGSVTLAVALWERLQLGVDTAVVLDQFRDDQLGDAALMPIDDRGLGEVTGTVKLGVLKQARDHADAALVLAATIPTGEGGDYMQADGVGWEPYVAVSHAVDTVRLVANVGFRSRQRTEIIDLVVDDEVFARLGIGVGLGPAEIGLGLIASTAAREPFSDAERSAVEALGQVGVDVGPVYAYAGGGVGLQGGFGTPDYRFLAGLRVVIDPREPTPRLAVDQPVRITARPPDLPAAEPEMLDDPIDVDSDDDGLLDVDDLCVKQPETVNGYNDEDGCPDAGDRDRDGVTDDVDLCPDEVADDSTSRVGCPDPDSDDDGLVDRLDTCPAQPGTEAHGGCKRKPYVMITEAGLTLTGKVLFNPGKASLNKKSHPVLDDIAAVVISHPALAKVVIEVHTGEKGTAADNLDLSRRRAESIKWYLVDKGVEESRFEVVGQGENVPVGGKAKERVELQLR